MSRVAEPRLSATMTVNVRMPSPGAAIVELPSSPGGCIVDERLLPFSPGGCIVDERLLPSSPGGCIVDERLPLLSYPVHLTNNLNVHIIFGSVSRKHLSCLDTNRLEIFQYHNMPLHLETKFLSTQL